MVEQKMLIDRKPVIYEGIFRMDELWAIINRFIKSRGMFMVELRNEEKVSGSGKDIFIELAPYRKISDYYKKILQIEVYVRKLRDRTVKVDGRPQKYQYGELEVYSSAILHTDWRSRWEGTGFYFLVRTIMDKFVKHDVLHDVENQTTKDCLDLVEEIKVYLNMSRFKLTEEDQREGRMHEGL